ncbi:MAG: hypothetical protein ACXVB2_25415 [Isosphaeraceae bacterium]
MRYDLTVDAARRICSVELNNLHDDVNAATQQRHLEVPATAYLTEVSATRSMVDSWRGRFDHTTPELDTVVDSLDTEIKWAEDELAKLAA